MRKLVTSIGRKILRKATPKLGFKTGKRKPLESVMLRGKRRISTRIPKLKVKRY